MRKQILTIAIPVSIGFFFNTMFNVVDTFWAGKIGPLALAALSATFPVFFLIIAFGNGFSIGTTALISNAIGAKQESRARAYYFHGIVISVAITLLISLCGKWLTGYMFALTRIPADIVPLAYAYILPILSTSAFFVLPFAFNTYLNAIGDTKPLRNSLIIGFFLNLILDPWFMYGGFGIPAFGIAGIAWATISVNILSSIYLLYVTYKRKLFAGFKDFILKWQLSLKVTKELYIQAIPSVANFTLIIFGSLVLFYYLSSFGSSVFSGYSIALRIEQIALLPAIGLNIAVLSLVGRNNGAGNIQAINEVTRAALKIAAQFMIPAGIVVWILAPHIVGLFTTDQTVITEALRYMLPAAIGLFAYAVLFVVSSTFQGIKKPFVSLIINLSRQIVLPFILFTILIAKGHFSIYSLWYGVLGITILSAIVSFMYLRRYMAHLQR